VNVDDVIDWRRASFLPHIARQHFPRNDLPFVPEQIFQKLKLSRCQFQVIAPAVSRCEVITSISKSAVVAGEIVRSARAEGAPELAPRAPEKANGFTKVIVGAFVEPLDAILDCISRRED